MAPQIPATHYRGIYKMLLSLRLLRSGGSVISQRRFGRFGVLGRKKSLSRLVTYGQEAKCGCGGTRSCQELKILIRVLLYTIFTIQILYINH